jgi:hypothetical protein
MAKKLTGAEAIAALQNQVSKAGVAKAEANARKAIDNKYPGLYIPGTRTSPDLARSRNKNFGK